MEGVDRGVIIRWFYGHIYRGKVLFAAASPNRCTVRPSVSRDTWVMRVFCFCACFYWVIVTARVQCARVLFMLIVKRAIRWSGIHFFMAG